MKTYLKLFWHFDQERDSTSPSLERILTLPVAGVYFALAITLIALFPIDYSSGKRIDATTWHLFAITIASLAYGSVFFHRAIKTMRRVRECLMK